MPHPHGPLQIGIAISRAASSAPTHSTMHIASALQGSGHRAWFIEPWDLSVGEDGRLLARAHGVEGAPSAAEWAERLRAGRTARALIPVARLDALLLRLNPMREAILNLASLAEAEGVRVLNPPGALLRCTSKAWLATLTGVPRPPTLVTRSLAAVEQFQVAHGPTVIKPARACGGRGVSLVRDRRGLAAAFRAAGGDRAGEVEGGGYVVAQGYLPEAIRGERRLLWLDGAFIGGYLRQRAPGDFRHNLQTGGIPSPLPADGPPGQTILDTLTPHLRRCGVWFAGVDVIGDKVVEVNVLNPGGLHWSAKLGATDPTHLILRSLESICGTPHEPTQAYGQAT